MIIGTPAALDLLDLRQHPVEGPQEPAQAIVLREQPRAEGRPLPQGVVGNRQLRSPRAAGPALFERAAKRGAERRTRIERVSPAVVASALSSRGPPIRGPDEPPSGPIGSGPVTGPPDPGRPPGETTMIRTNGRRQEERRSDVCLDPLCHGLLSRKRLQTDSMAASWSSRLPWNRSLTAARRLGRVDKSWVGGVARAISVGS